MIGRLVKRRREARGLSQTELALATGLRQVYISQVESGQIRVPREHNLAALGKALGISKREFYAEAGMLEGLPADAMPPRPQPEEPTGDKDWDPRKLVAWVEQHPDEQFRAELAVDAEQMSPEDYEAFCLAIAKAWLANGQLAQRIARLHRQPHHGPSH